MTDNIFDQLSRDGAECALYWDAPQWGGHPTLAVGQFACDGESAGAALLEEAKGLARRRGVGRIIGPMDGDTWHRYRVVTRSDGSPPFLLEPTSGVHDHQAFRRAGFEPISEYSSTRADLATAIGEPATPLPGISITQWDGNNVEGLISQLFALSSKAFSNNAFFKPITHDAFLTLYEPIIPLIDPDFVLFAHGPEEKLVGFLFGYPNAGPAGTAPAVIVKTYASGLRGCGFWLLDTFHRRARERGFQEVIHALMHGDNISRRRSAKHGAVTFREYALMGIDLEDKGS